MASADTDGENNRKQRNKLLKIGAKDHWDLDEDREIFWWTEESPVNGQDD
jgi:hypothetical protein